MRYEVCWAKTTSDGQPGLSVHDHCLNVGCVAEALIEVLPGELQRLLPHGTASLAALHDIGKVSPGFQRKCAAWLGSHSSEDPALAQCWSPDHAKTGQDTLRRILRNSRLHDWAAAVGAHHGSLKPNHGFGREPWEVERQRLVDALIAEFGPLPDQEPEESLLWFVAGFISVADWIGSDETNFPQQADWGMTERRQRGRAALARVHWKSPAVRSPAGFADLFPGIESPNSLQVAAMRTIREPGIYVIEGPMGCGKTEAALAAAHHLIASGKANGIYFALPTQLTSNRIHLRMREFVKHGFMSEEQVRLVHSASWLEESELPMKPSATGRDTNQQEDARAGRSWFASSKRALLAPFGVGTVDQALLGIVAAKHFFVRQFGLAGKVVILDEVHTYDMYTGTLIGVLVNRLRELHSTVLVLSATLTAKQRRQLLQLDPGAKLGEAYPLISANSEPPVEVPCDPPDEKRVAVRFMDASRIIGDCLDRASQGQCVLWIRNTVDDAQQTYRDLRSANREGGPPIALLHARFPFFRRAELENYWMDALGKDACRRPAGCVLVSTQVAEQSVDIDADLLITDLAPTDMLLQRLGRLWRHERPMRPCSQPEIWIPKPPLSWDELRQASARQLRESLGKSARVYAPYVLLRSFEQWRCCEEVALPAGVRTILEATYADPAADEPAGWRELRDQMETQKKSLAARALTGTRVWSMPELADEEGVQTRFSSYETVQLLLARSIVTLDAHTVRVALLDGTVIEPGDHDWDFASSKAIHLNLARVPRWTVGKVGDNAPGWLSKQVSQSTVVGIVGADATVKWPGSEVETGLSYHVDQGIMIRREQIGRACREEFDESYD